MQTQSAPASPTALLKKATLEEKEDPDHVVEEEDESKETGKAKF